MKIPIYQHKIERFSCTTTSYMNFPLHLHSDLELVRVRAGKLKVQIHTQEYIVSAGELAIIFPNIIHSYQPITGTEDTIIDFLICGQDLSNGFPRNFIGSRLVDPVIPVSTLHPEVESVFSSLMNEITGGKNIRIVEAYLQILWLRLMPNLTVTDFLHPATANLITKLITYISEHYCEPLSLDILSAEFGVCTAYLSRIFTQVLHVRFPEYVNTLRIEYAKTLLLQSRDNIIYIAMQCGFQSQQTFNRVFKQLCNMTPAAYRKRGIAD